MIVTSQPRAPLRYHFVVAGVAFVIAAVWPTSTPPASSPEAAAPASLPGGLPGVALLQTGTSADTWIEPVAGRTADGGNTGALLGFRLTSVRPGSAWAKAGLTDGDVVVAVDGHALSQDGFTDLSRVLDAFTQRPAVVVRYQRDGQEFTATLNLL